MVITLISYLERQLTSNACRTGYRPEGARRTLSCVVIVFGVLGGKLARFVSQTLGLAVEGPKTVNENQLRELQK